MLPMVAAKVTVIKPADTLSFAPTNTLLRISLPNLSVPNQCSLLGGFNLVNISCPKGSYGAIWFANIAIIIQIKQIVTPTAKKVLVLYIFRNFFIYHTSLSDQ